MIKLDLATDLAKVTSDTLGKLGDCHYSAPCAIGAMMTPEQRKELAEANRDGCNILALTGYHYAVSVPAEQLNDVVALQRAFDRGDSRPDEFFTLLTELKEKYKCA